MRTNIVIDDQLISKAMDLTGISTKREVIDHALRILVRNYQQSAVLALRGNLQWEGDLAAMREGRVLYAEGPQPEGPQADALQPEINSNAGTSAGEPLCREQPDDDPTNPA